MHHFHVTWFIQKIEKRGGARMFCIYVLLKFILFEDYAMMYHIFTLRCSIKKLFFPVVVL